MNATANKKTVSDLEAARIRLEEAQADYAKILADERSTVIREIKDLIKTYGLEAKQLFPKSAIASDSDGAKYFDQKTGNSWSGKGRAKEPFQSIRNDPAKLAKYLVSEKKS